MKQAITSTASFRYRNNNLIEVVFFDEVLVEYKNMKDNIKTLEIISQEKKLSRLIVLNEFTDFNMESIQLLIDENRKRKSSIISEAIIVKSISNRLVANYYYQQNKKFYKIKLFENATNAKKWIEEISKSKNKLINEN